MSATPSQALTDEELLDLLQRRAFNYFWNEANPSNGLVKDRSTTGSPASIAATGFGLSTICIGIDHGWISRSDGADRVLTTLETFWNGPQGPDANGMIGYKGLFYHFLDMTTARRTWDCELSTIDTALLFAGVLDAKQYFDTNDPVEQDIRALADSLYYRADWEFVRNGTSGIRMGWKPDTGFSSFGLWRGYNEAMILYILALGSPTFPVPEVTWDYWTSGYQWATQYGQTYVIFPPLFGHQYSHCWIDYRSIWDEYMEAKGISYFENSRRATIAAREYCIANPGGHIGYSGDLWGLTASDDPFGYSAHGAPPPQNDNGTITPTAAASSLPFAPEYVLPTLQYMYSNFSQLWGPYGFKDAFNLDFGWFASDYLGIDQGPIAIMIENYLTGSVWERIRANQDVQTGLARAGFTQTSDAPGPVRQMEGVTLMSDPNPFSTETTVDYSIPRDAEVSLGLFTASGRKVRELFQGERVAGDYRVQLDAQDLESGVYYFVLEVDGARMGRRCVLVR
ncbi:MAG: Tat pathway signal protein [Candidatus Eisenbacteria bacterium]|nr:Tat pathway signal protein [Candidatus Eisenbacteria bacterium]